MAGRRSPVTESREILRRRQLGERARRIARELGVSRNTVAHYRRWAATHSLLTGPLPEAATLAALLTVPPAQRPAQEQSLVEPFGEQVLAWHAKGVEGQAVWQLLVEQLGFGATRRSSASCAGGASDAARDAAPRSAGHCGPTAPSSARRGHRSKPRRRP